MLAAAPAFADETTGTILAFDRVDGVIVLNDKTVWSLELLDVQPTDLKAGDFVRIMYDTAGEDGLTKIASIEKNG